MPVPVARDYDGHITVQYLSVVKGISSGLPYVSISMNTSSLGRTGDIRDNNLLTLHNTINLRNVPRRH